ncbi:MAG: LytTR family DNA-binding domain-containing protein [Bacteroidota bacterium]
MRIVIIEDEKLTAKDLAATIRSLAPEVEILPFLSSVEDALGFFEQQPQVDLIFSDIQLGDGLSFDIFNKVQVAAPIIFCTAYEQYTLDAFRVQGIDYILKPFDPKRVAAALANYEQLKAKFATTPPDLSTIAANWPLAPSARPSSVIIRKGDKIIPINEADIALFFIRNEQTYLYTFERQQFAINYTLDTLEGKFPGFFRVNRQILIHRKAVKEAAYYFKRKLLVYPTIPFPEQILVGKLKATAFIEWLEGQ